jgi:predicted amidohydrolase
MKSPLRIAASQFPVSGNVARNSDYIETQMKEAASRGAHLIQFPESALSGYGPSHFSSADDTDWATLENCQYRICQLASLLNIWVVLGTIRKSEAGLPLNCLNIISNTGEMAGTYDKQRLYPKEKNFYQPGDGPLVLDINGYLCGFLICYDNCFPELYEHYRDMGVGLLFNSFHNAGNSRKTGIKELIAANLIVRAADNCMWISASNSSKRYSPLSACVVRPDGSIVRLKKAAAGIIMDDYPLAELGWTYDNRKT